MSRSHGEADDPDDAGHVANCQGESANCGTLRMPAMHARLVALLAAPLLSSALQCGAAPLSMRPPRIAASTSISMASPADNWINGKKDAFNAEKQAKISQQQAK